MKWGHRRNFKDGKVYYRYASFLGYRKGPDGLPEIDPDEAAIVRRIFARYLLGQSVHQICRDLMSDGVKTAQGSNSWHDSVVRKMLQNEKYIGDALLQKTFMADLFPHEQRKNMGELPQYYVHECHPAIIDRDTFQRVQEELPRRSSLRKTSSKSKTELFQLAVSAGPDCLEYDEEIQRVNMAKTCLMAKKAELEREGRTAAAFNRRTSPTSWSRRLGPSRSLTRSPSASWAATSR